MQKRRILWKYLRCKGKEGVRAVFDWFKKEYSDDLDAQAIGFPAFKQECYRLARRAKKAGKVAGKRTRKPLKKRNIKAVRKWRKAKEKPLVSPPALPAPIQATFVVLVDREEVWEGSRIPRVKVERREVVKEI